MKTCGHLSELIIICDYYYDIPITLRIKTVKFSIELTQYYHYFHFKSFFLAS